jgi:hypothetical protein
MTPVEHERAVEQLAYRKGPQVQGHGWTSMLNAKSQIPKSTVFPLWLALAHAFDRRDSRRPARRGDAGEDGGADQQRGRA